MGKEGSDDLHQSERQAVIKPAIWNFDGLPNRNVQTPGTQRDSRR